MVSALWLSKRKWNCGMRRPAGRQTPFNHAGHLLPTFEIMVVVTMFVLLIVCANVGNLLLVRSFARRHETTVRLSMGARPGRLLKQLLIEGAILSTLAAAGGLLVAYGCRDLITLLFPTQPGINQFTGGNRLAG